MRGCAAAAVLALLAAANVTAAERQRSRERAAADAVTATAVLTGTTVRYGEGLVELLVSISSSGPSLGVGRPRVDAPGVVVEVVSQPRTLVPADRTGALDLRLRTACSNGHPAVAQPRSVRVVVDVVPPSGRRHSIEVDAPATELPGLLASACGALPPDQATEPQVTAVQGSRYYVDFLLRLGNRSTRPVTLQALAGEGLALSVRGGLPTTIGPRATTTLQVRLAVPSCAQLPEPLDAQRIDALPFGAVELELTDGRSHLVSLPYLPAPGSELAVATRTLAHAICPRVVL